MPKTSPKIQQFVEALSECLGLTTPLPDDPKEAAAALRAYYDERHAGFRSQIYAEQFAENRLLRLLGVVVSRNVMKGRSVVLEFAEPISLTRLTSAGLKVSRTANPDDDYPYIITREGLILCAEDGREYVATLVSLTDALRGEGQVKYLGTLV